jgi:hypothetical protein
MTLHLPSGRPSCCQLHRASISAAVKPNISIDSERFSCDLGYVLVLLDRLEQGQQPRDSHETLRKETRPLCPPVPTLRRPIVYAIAGSGLHYRYEEIPLYAIMHTLPGLRVESHCQVAICPEPQKDDIFIEYSCPHISRPPSSRI